MFFSSKQKKLFSAIKKNDTQRIEELLNEVDPNVFRKGMTPLMYAAKQGNITAIEKIIHKGGSPSILDKDKRSPLMYAADSGHSNAVYILTLVDQKIISYRDIKGLSAVNYAYIKGHQEIVEEIKNQGFENRLPLHILNRFKEVSVSGTGEDIRNIDLSIRNKTEENKLGIVLSGTVFHSTDDTQDMVCAEQFNFDLRAKGSFHPRVSVACVDGNKTIPRSHNNFRNTSFKDKNLIRIVNEMKGRNPNSLQAAIWAYKNRYSSQEIMNKLREGHLGRTVINQENIKEAQKVLSKLNIYRNL